LARPTEFEPVAFGSGGQEPDAQPPYLQRFAAAANSRCQLSAPHDAPYPRQRRYARSAEVCPRRRAAARAWPSTVPARRIPRLDMQSPAVQPSRRPGETRAASKSGARLFRAGAEDR